MNRIALFLGTNLAVMLVLAISGSVLGLTGYLTEQGLDQGRLLGFAALMGFGGSFISLWLSKPIAKWSTKAKVIDSPSNDTERWLVETVSTLAQKAGIAMPEVAIYEGGPNAFATGATRNSSLVAVSTGLLEALSRSEVEAVLAHEVAHVANGDMVTLTLVQGVVNTFVFFLARMIAYGVQKARAQSNEAISQTSYRVTAFVLDLLFGVLAMYVVEYFSRQREFKADSDAAYLMGSPGPMISALRKLGKLEPEGLPEQMAASGIAGKGGVRALFATHPSIESRIAALEG